MSKQQTFDREAFEEAGVRYRVIAKNLARAQTMFALANLYAVQQKLKPPAARAAL